MLLLLSCSWDLWLYQVRLAAEVTGEGSVPGVCGSVLLQQSSAGEQLGANEALVAILGVELLNVLTMLL